MPYGVYLPGRWRRQPQGAVEVDWGHPLSRGLQFLVFGASARDCVGGIIPTIVGTAPTVAVSSFGTGLQFSGSNALSYARQARHQPTAGASVLCVCLPDARSNNTTAYPFSSGDAVDTGAKFNVAAVNHEISSFGSHYIHSAFGNSGGFSYGASSYIGENVAYARPLVFSASAAPSINSRSFRDRLWREQFGSAIDSHYTPTDGAIVIGARNATPATAFPGAVYLSALWTRMLPDAEHLAIHDNPWQLLRPRRPIIYSLPASGPVLSGATVIDIGQTSARPRVTITI